ncbi:MAG TPA: metal-dependent hydrolase [Acidimicrobiia bacterium]|nr:metal-dependent hydrolase [Acidimicrobiia bacterium]
MEARKVDLDFSAAQVYWNPAEPEYCQLLNAISTLLPDLEPLLIKAVRAAQEKLPADIPADFRRDLRLFVAQEGRHYRMHKRFNDMLVAQGYDWLPVEQQRLAADFDRFFHEKGVKFSLAYSEGFETFGPLVSMFFFEEAGVLMADWDEPTTYLWLWHFAEEYEHRSVCNHLYHRVYGGSVYGGYWYRIYGLWYATIHLFAYSFRVALRLLATDRRTGRLPRWRFSRLRFARLLLRFARYMLPKMVLGCMRPGYDPATIPPPRHSLAFLEAASQRYGILEPV